MSFQGNPLRFQFSLRSMLISVVVAAIACSLIFHFLVAPIRRLAEARRQFQSVHSGLSIDDVSQMFHRYRVRRQLYRSTPGVDDSVVPVETMVISVPARPFVGLVILVHLDAKDTVVGKYLAD